MDDQERIITLRRSGFSNRTIAAIVGVDTGDVNDALAGIDPLPVPSGGGGASGPSGAAFIGHDFGDVTNDGDPGLPQNPAVANLIQVRIILDVPDGGNADCELYIVDPDDVDTRQSVDYFAVTSVFAGELSMHIPYLPAGMRYRIFTSVGGGATLNLGDVTEVEYPS